jgi:hypothetical protein
MGWLALVAGPDARYAGMIAPMAIGGIGFSLAIPAITKSVVSLVAPQDIGKASGTYGTTCQLGGAFGVAILGAVFAATGGYASAQTFSDGYAPALGVAAITPYRTRPYRLHGRLGRWRHGNHRAAARPRAGYAVARCGDAALTLGRHGGHWRDSGSNKHTEALFNRRGSSRWRPATSAGTAPRQ